MSCVLHAPRSNETVAVREALHASAVKMLHLAKAKELEVDQAEPGAADSDAFRRLLETTDLMKVLCHGQVTKEDHQVVLVIDHEHASPPGYSFGVTLETTQGHRFGRDQLLEQRIASRTIFLGAEPAQAEGDNLDPQGEAGWHLRGRGSRQI
jgi:hypothetical protein